MIVSLATANRTVVIFRNIYLSIYGDSVELEFHGFLLVIVPIWPEASWGPSSYNKVINNRMSLITYSKTYAIRVAKYSKCTTSHSLSLKSTDSIKSAKPAIFQRIVAKLCIICTSIWYMKLEQGMALMQVHLQNPVVQTHREKKTLDSNEEGHM